MSLTKMLFALLVCFTLLIANNSAYAEVEFKDEEYNKFVTEVFVKAEKPIPENYKKLRELYSQTSFYDPNFQASEIKDAVMNLVPEALTEDEIKRHEENLYNVTIKHMGHINIHKYTSDLYWSKGRKDLAGKSGQIANYIALTAQNGGDGLTPKTAFKAINKAEQVFILEYFLKKNYTKVSLDNIEGRLYDVYETFDKEGDTSTNKPTKTDIYFDITHYFGKGALAREMDKQSEHNDDSGQNVKSDKP